MYMYGGLLKNIQTWDLYDSVTWFYNIYIFKLAHVGIKNNQQGGGHMILLILWW